jgi:hypothetical protein
MKARYGSFFVSVVQSTLAIGYRMRSARKQFLPRTVTEGFSINFWIQDYQAFYFKKSRVRKV